MFECSEDVETLESSSFYLALYWTEIYMRSMQYKNALQMLIEIPDVFGNYPAEGEFDDKTFEKVKGFRTTVAISPEPVASGNVGYVLRLRFPETIFINPVLLMQIKTQERKYNIVAKSIHEVQEQCRARLHTFSALELALAYSIFVVLVHERSHLLHAKVSKSMRASYQAFKKPPGPSSPQGRPETRALLSTASKNVGGRVLDDIGYMIEQQVSRRNH